MREPHIEIVDLGTWGGRLHLLAEYDGTEDTIRVNARIVERVSVAAGEAEAARFVACAVAHERYHRAHPGASEGEARRYAAATSGFDAARLEALSLTSRRAHEGERTGRLDEGSRSELHDTSRLHVHGANESHAHDASGSRRSDGSVSSCGSGGTAPYSDDGTEARFC